MLCCLAHPANSVCLPPACSFATCATSRRRRDLERYDLRRRATQLSTATHPETRSPAASGVMPNHFPYIAIALAQAGPHPPCGPTPAFAQVLRRGRRGNSRTPSGASCPLPAKPSPGDTRACHRIAPSRYSPVAPMVVGGCVRGESQAAVSVREVPSTLWCSHAHITLIPDSLGVVCHFARGWHHLGFPCNSYAMTLGRGIKIKGTSK